MADDPYPKHLPLNRYGFAQTRARMLENIESVWKSVNASREAIAEVQETIARANEILARGMSDRRDIGR